MGFRHPRAFCPACGGKVHQKYRRTAPECPHCGAKFTRKLDWSNKAVLQPVPESEPKPSWPPPRRPQPAPKPEPTVDRLAELVQMREAGHLTAEEFAAAKRQVLGE